MSNITELGDLDNSLPSWISDHLGEKSYMADEVNHFPSSPREDSSSLEGSPPTVPLPSIEKEINIMTQGDLDQLKESCSIPSNI